MLVDLKGIRAVLVTESKDVLDDLPHQAPPAGSSPSAAGIHGAVIMRDRLMAAIDVEHWEEHEINEVDDLRERVGRYCFNFCPLGQAMRPGRHPRCSACPLVVLTVEALEAQVARAKEEE